MRFARTLFGTEEKALAWMHRPASYLPHKPPVTPAHPAIAAGAVEASVEDIWIDARFIR